MKFFDDTISQEDIFNFSQEILKKNTLNQEDAQKLIELKEKSVSMERSPVIEFYPSLMNEDFQSKITSKKEYKLSTIKQPDPNATDETLCKFNLSQNQKFLKNFISEKTPYNGLLLFHGTGVGKTCSAISIAEQFLERLEKMNKKVIVLLNPSIKANFMKNIFDVQKLIQGFPEDQCTRTKYLELLDIDIKNLNKIKDFDRIQKRVKRLIQNRYGFYGYEEFGNMIKKMENVDALSISDDRKQALIEKRYKNMFSDTVIIIDEAHNIKASSGAKETKFLPPLLTKIIKKSLNTKLVLLTATPMFDNATEIVFLINLLLMNDKRPTIEIKDFFNKKTGFIKLNKKKEFIEKTRGYVSFLRGNHPFKFPKKLYPDIYGEKDLIKSFPKMDVNGTTVQPIEHLKIVGCEMKGLQKELYEGLDMNKSNKNVMGAFNTKGSLVANVVFPTKGSSVSMKISNRGFDAMFEKKSNKKYVFNEMLLKENIGNYSCKIKKILDVIENSTGIVFIYSQFISGGILPLALALEANGYNKYDGNLMENVPKSNKKYIMITGDSELSKNSYENYLKIEKENVNGDKVKVILGSASASEGLDFKNIREVHVMNPWHHLNRLDQVVGRAVRNCSHTALPKAQRNVMIYYYASVLENRSIETIDLKMYRIAEEKSKPVAEISYLLRGNAVDCLLNKNENVFIGKNFNKTMEIETSRQTNHSITLEDTNNSRDCLYRNCSYNCLNKPSDSLDESTYSFDDLYDYHYDIIKIIKTAFKNTVSLNMASLEKEFVKHFDKTYTDMLHKTLLKMVDNNILVDKNHVLRIKNKNVFVKKPVDLKDAFVSFHDLRVKTRKKIKGYVIDTSKQLKTKKKTTDVSKDSIEIFVQDLEKKYNDLIDNSFEKTKLNALYKKYGPYMIFDRLSPEQKRIKIVEHIQNNDKKLVKDYLLDNNAGFKIATNNKTIKYYFNDGKPMNKAPLSYETNLMALMEKEPQGNSIIGYLEQRPKEVVFKIRDKVDEGSKGTQIKTGSVCGNEGMKKGKIVEFLNSVKGTTNTNSKPGKPNLCFELELELRNKDRSQYGNKRWFYNSVEAVEREFYKKKK